MKNPIKALLWEQWRQTRWQIAIAGLLFLAYIPFSPAVVEFENLLYFLGDMKEDLNTWLILTGLIPFLFINPSAKNIEESFSQRLFTLPVSTTKLMLAHILYKLSVIALFGLLISVINHFQFDSEIPAWWAMLVLLALTVSYQAFIFLRGGMLSIARALTFLLLLFSLYLFLQIFGHAVGVSSTSWFEPGPLPDQRLAAVQCLAALAAGFYLCFHNLHRARSGECENVSANEQVNQVHAKTQRQKRPFRSVLTAQIWFEWRQTLYVLPVTFAALTISFTALLIWNPGNSILIILFPVVPVLIGFYLLRISALYRNFVLSRPITTVKVSDAKLWAGANTLLLTCATCMTILMAAILLFADANFGFREAFPIFTIVCFWIPLISWLALMMGRLALTVFTISAVATLLFVGAIALVEYFGFPLQAILLRNLEILAAGVAKDPGRGVDLVVVLAAATVLILLAINWFVYDKKWYARHYLPHLSILVLPACLVPVIMDDTLGGETSGIFITFVLVLLPMVILVCEAYQRKLVPIKRVFNAITIMLLIFLATFMLWHYSQVELDYTPVEYLYMPIWVMPCLAPLAWVPLVIHFQRHR